MKLDAPAAPETGAASDELPEEFLEFIADWDEEDGDADALAADEPDAPAPPAENGRTP